MPPLYDRIGQHYRATRAADPRITDQLVALLSLPAGSILCDIGAGSGNYTNALADRGYDVIAVEPSAVMRQQAKPHNKITWLEGTAEDLSRVHRRIDGVVCTLAAHHFTDLATSARELHRVCPRGPFVFFTMDPRAGHQPWFADYFPEIRRNDFVLFPRASEFMETIHQSTGRVGEVIPFPLPNDLIDLFMYGPWSRPEVYLDPVFRANTSGFANADRDTVDRGLDALRADLASGSWDARYGQVRTMKEFDAGFCFIALRPA